MKVIAGNSNRPLAEAISAVLSAPLTKANVKRFADQEVFVEILENVRGEDCFIIQSTSAPANDHLMELLVIMDALKRVESGLSVPDLCRDLGISSATFYKWRAKYGGLDAPMMSRMKELELENARLKKMYAEERLKAEILKEAMAKKW